MNDTTTEPKRVIVDIAYVEAAFEGWARWCFAGRRPAQVSNTGRLMLSFRSNVCPGWLDDIIAGRGHHPSCPDCHGKGRIKFGYTRHQINPACIRDTRHGGGPSHSDRYTGLDELICGWREHDATFWLNEVTVAEYLWRSATQERKARYLRISRSFYHKNLREAHYLGERMLVEKRL